VRLAGSHFGLHRGTLPGPGVSVWGLGSKGELAHGGLVCGSGACGGGVGLEGAGPDLLDEVGESGEQLREPGQEQRDHHPGPPVFGGLTGHPQHPGEAFGDAGGGGCGGHARYLHERKFGVKNKR